MTFHFMRQNIPWYQKVIFQEYKQTKLIGKVFFSQTFTNKIFYKNDNQIQFNLL